MSENNTNLVDLKHVLELAEKYKDTEIITLKDGFEVEFNPLFATDKIDNLITISGEILISKEKEGQPFIELIKSSEQNFITFLHFLMIREFTHLGEQMKDTAPSKLFPYFEALITTGYLTELVEDAFSYEEVKKVIDRVGEVSALGQSMNDLGLAMMDSMDKHKDKIERIQSYQKKHEEAKSKNKKK